MRTPDPVRRFIEALLPWYSPEVERVRAQRTEAIRQSSIKARIEAEEAIAADRADLLRGSFARAQRRIARP